MEKQVEELKEQIGEFQTKLQRAESDASFAKAIAVELGNAVRILASDPAISDTARTKVDKILGGLGV